MKLKIFTKHTRAVSSKNNQTQESVIKVGKKQLEKLMKKGIYVQLFTNP